MTNSVCVIFASFQPEVQSFGALAQSTNSPLVRILPSDFKSLRLRARHAFGTFGEYRTRQKDYDRASASKSDYWVGNPKCSLAFHRARACKRVVWVIAERIFPGCLARCTVSYVFAQELRASEHPMLFSRVASAPMTLYYAIFHPDGLVVVCSHDALMGADPCVTVSGGLHRRTRVVQRACN